MATFYLLPPRPLVEDTLAQSAGTFLPGLPPTGGPELTAALESAVGRRPDVFLVFREELPDGVTADALRDGFGAEAGDEVVEVRAGGVVRHWRIGDAA